MDRALDRDSAYRHADPVAAGKGGYETGFRNYADFAATWVYPWTLLRTVAFSIIATVLTFLIGFPVAYYIAKIAQGRTKAALFMLCLLPFWVSEIVRVFGWMLLLRETGLISNALQGMGIISAPVEFLYNDAAILIGLVYTSMLIAGSIVVSMLALGNYLTPTLLGGKSGQWFTAQIYSQFITRFNWELGSAFGFILLATSSALVWLLLRLSGQSLSNTLGR